jgi:subtilisin family serine protease
LWAQGIDGTGLVFASADTGVQWDHPALINAYRGWNGVAADHNTNWWDAIHEAGGDLPAPYDDNGHGTHTTGIAVGSPVEHAIGVAPGAKWIACRNMLNGVGTPSRYIECLQFFLAPTDLAGNNPDPAKAPDVINNSYACPTYEGCAVRALQAAVEAVREAGIFFAVSAGNDGYLGCGTIDEPPAIEPAGFTVGATGYDDRIAPFSSRGPVSVDGLSWRKPEISAPGMSVNTGGIFSSVNNSSYDYKRGTSMASPHVAGAVLLLWQAEPALRGQVGASESLLELSALHLPPPENEPLCGDDTASRIPNNVYGWGRLDVANAVLLAGLDQFAYFPFVSR